MSLKSSTPKGSQIFLDIPEINPEAVSLVKHHNMEMVFETARMYTGKISGFTNDKNIWGYNFLN